MFTYIAVCFGTVVNCICFEFVSLLPGKVSDCFQDGVEVVPLRPCKVQGLHSRSDSNALTPPAAPPRPPLPRALTQGLQNGWAVCDSSNPNSTTTLSL